MTTHRGKREGSIKSKQKTGDFTLKFSDENLSDEHRETQCRKREGNITSGQKLQKSFAKLFQKRKQK